jgi:hypothetical protein
MHGKLSKKLIIALGVGVLVLGGFFITSQASAAPTIQWTPGKVTETILAGESKTIPVSFTASKTITNAILRVVPKLEPFVRVTPLSFGNIAKGETVSVDITISAPLDSLPGMLDGTIQLKDGGKSTSTHAKPLPVTLAIEWSKISSDAGGYEIAYSPEFQISGASDGQNLGFLSPSTILARESNAIEAFDDISLVVVENPGALAISEFAKGYDDGWYESYKSREEVVIASRNAIRYNDIGTVPGRAPMIAVFVDGSSRIFILTINRYESPESTALISIFDQMISSFVVH